MACAAVITTAVAWAGTDQVLLVVCSPGSPGSTEEAQPRMDAFAAALSAKTGAPVAAVYEPSAEAGAKRLEGAGVAIVSLPFFLEHEKQLGLHARLQVVQKGRPALERWALVTQKGRAAKAEALAGTTIVANTAFAPRFVAAAVHEIGALPADVKLTQSTQVVSALRRAANGEAVAVLVDGPQEAALASLPFASKLEIVARSPAWPGHLVVTIDSRMPAKLWNPMQTALLGLASDRASSGAMEGLQMDGFAAVDDGALTSARNAYASAR
jgi:ABC-type phosphate/phosphonate transport system substrate-binding protein